MTPNETTLRSYMDAIDAADYEAAASYFADDAVYLRPALNKHREAAAVLPQTRLDGLDNIRELWRQRGKQDTRHEFRWVSTTESETFVEGELVFDGTMTAPFMCHASFNAEGKIARFIAMR